MGFPNSRSMDLRGLEVEAKLFTTDPDETTTTVTQATNRSTGVTLNATAGQITTDATSLAAAAEATFTVTNSYVTAKSVVLISHASGGAGTPMVFVSAVAAGSFDITMTNLHASTANDAASVINFVVIDVI